MVDFAGWDMPVNYGSQIEEHHAVRRDAGMFDVSHMLAVDVEGADAERWLRGLPANDVFETAHVGQGVYSCMLNPQGGVIDDLIRYFFDEQQTASWSTPGHRRQGLVVDGAISPIPARTSP